MSEDHPLLACIADAFHSRMAVYVDGDAATAILDGEGHEASYMSGLPDGFYIARPDDGELLDLILIDHDAAISALVRAGMIHRGRLN